MPLDNEEHFYTLNVFFLFRIPTYDLKYFTFVIYPRPYLNRKARFMMCFSFNIWTCAFDQAYVQTMNHQPVCHLILPYALKKLSVQIKNKLSSFAKENKHRQLSLNTSN